MMKKLLFSVVVILLISNDNCTFGAINIDSLLNIAKKENQAIKKIKLLNQISFSYINNDPSLGVKYGRQALELAKLHNLKNEESIALLNIGSNYINIDSGQLAVFCLNESLKICRELDNKIGAANALANLGNLFLNQSDYPSALKNYFESLKIEEEFSPDKAGINITLGNIGVVYYYMGNYDKSIEYYNKALAISEGLNRRRDIANNLGNIALVYHAKSDFEKSLEYNFRALKIYLSISDSMGIAGCYGNIGNSYQDLSNFTKAIFYHKKALKVYNEVGSIREAALDISSIGNIYFDYFMFNKHKNILNNSLVYKSIDFLEKGTAISLSISDFYNAKDNLFILSDAYKEIGNYKMAFEVYSKAIALKDSLFSIEEISKINKLENQREIDIRDKEIEIEKLKNEKITTQRMNLFIGIIVLFIGVISLIYLLTLINRQKKKADKLLLNILPRKIANRLKNKEKIISDHFESVSIVFIDIKGFTDYSRGKNPQIVVEMLNEIFTRFDRLANKYGLEKIKTIGDAYMAAAGLPEICNDHPLRVAKFSIDVQKTMTNFINKEGLKMEFRIGIGSGSVVAGIIGENKFSYDMWGDTVNKASRMESNGVPGKIQVSEEFYNACTKLNSNLDFEYRGKIKIKGYDESVDVWFLNYN